MDEIKKDTKPKQKPEVRKGQIRSFTSKNNTITKKNPNKKQALKVPILAIKNKKKMKKKIPLNKRSLGEKKKIIQKKVKKNNRKVKPPQKDLMSEDEVEYEPVSGINERKRRQ